MNKQVFETRLSLELAKDLFEFLMGLLKLGTHITAFAFQELNNLAARQCVVLDLHFNLLKPINKNMIIGVQLFCKHAWIQD